MKKCKTCGVNKPLTEFRKCKNSFNKRNLNDKTYNVCKACIKNGFSTIADRAKFNKNKRRIDKKLSSSQINYLSDFFEGK